MHRRELFFVLAAFLVGSFLLIHRSYANDVPIAITEIGAYEAADHEWIEVVNRSDAAVDIVGWKFFENSTNHGLTLVQGENSLLQPGEYAVIAQKADVFLSDYPSTTARVFDSSWSSLNESGEEIGLKNEHGTVVELFTYIDAADFSLQRIDIMVNDYTDSNWVQHEAGNSAGKGNEFVEVELPDFTDVPPNEIDTTSTPDIVPEEIFDDTTTTPEVSFVNYVFINEIVSNPELGNEWIEIINSTSTVVDLTGYELRDGAGRIGSLSATIDGNGLFVFDLSTAKLNNSGDVVTLRFEDFVVDTLVYGDWEDGNVQDNAPAPGKGQSIARSGDTFFLTTTVTKSAQNIITDVQIIPAEPETSGGGSASQDTSSFPLSYASNIVIINEFVSDPADEKDEFVELYNTSNQSIDLRDWAVVDGGGTKTMLNEQMIVAHGFVVVEKPKGHLNNSGDIIVLVDPAGNTIDSVTYGNWDDGNIDDNAPAASDPNGIAREQESVTSKFIVTDTLTPGEANVIHVHIPDSDNSADEPIDESDDGIQPDADVLESDSAELLITEIYPNPPGVDDEEFIELYNPLDHDVPLTGLRLDDKEGGSRPYKLKSILPALSYIALYRKDTGITLNNTSDEARLLSAGNSVLAHAMYENVQEGQSYILDEDGMWQWTAVPTPGDENIFSLKDEGVKNENADENVKTTIGQLINFDVGDMVSVLGTVLVRPDVFGSQYFYIGETSASDMRNVAGVQVYMQKKDFPDMSVGDVVEVRGVIANTTMGRRIKVKQKEDVEIVSAGPFPMATRFEVAMLSDEHVGRFVQVSGEVTDSKTSYMYVDDGTEELKVYFKKNARIDKKEFTPGETVTVNGILVLAKNEFQLLPRNQDDITKETIETSAPVVEIKKPSENKDKHVVQTYATAAAGGVSSILVGLFAKLHGSRVIGFVRRVIRK